MAIPRYQAIDEEVVRVPALSTAMLKQASQPPVGTPAPGGSVVTQQVPTASGAVQSAKNALVKKLNDAEPQPEPPMMAGMSSWVLIALAVGAVWYFYMRKG